MAGVAFSLRLYVARGWLLLTFAVSVTALVAERELIRRLLAVLRRRGHLLVPLLIVGANAEGQTICSTLVRDPSLGYKVLGFLDDHVPVGAFVAARPNIGRLDDAVEVVTRTGAGGVVIATTGVDQATVNRLTRQLVDRGVEVELSSSLQDIAAERLTLWALGRHPVVYVQPRFRRGWRGIGKRAFDLVLSTVGLVLSAPALLLAAIAIKLDSRGPVLFHQQRVGRDGQPFSVLKLRSMVANAEELIIDLRDLNEADGPLFKMRRDPRVTRVGRLLRRLSIDEVPQLWNVIRGEMSLVGPRPALPGEVVAWDRDLHQRLRVKPGITGMWQVNGRSNASFDDYTRLDLYYVDNWSLWTDLAILAKTVPTVAFRRGCY